MINILIHTDTRYPVNRKKIRKAIVDTFAGYKLDSLDAEVSVAVVGTRKMNELVRHYLGDFDKHEILSFALEEVSGSGQVQHHDGFGQGFINPPDGVLRLGDIVLCWAQLLEAASRDDLMVDDEIYRLTCHGVKHLLGEHPE